MASPTYAFRRIRDARRQVTRTDQPRDYRRERYRAILEAVYELADEETHDDLTGWIITETVHDGELPHPDDLRERARELVVYRGGDVPDDSPLRE